MISMQKLVKIAERKFVIEAEQRRVWDLLGPALLNSPLGLEKIEVIDEEHVRAELRLKFAFITIPTRLTVVFLELDEPNRMVTALEAKALGGLIQLNQRVVFTLSPQDDKHTEVACEALAERSNPILFAMLGRKARSVAGTTLMGIEETLRRKA